MKSQSSIKRQIKYFRIIPLGNHCSFEQTFYDSMYQEKTNGFVRKSILGESITNWKNRTFHNQFIKNSNIQFQYRRIFDLYNAQFDLFLQNINYPSFVMPSQKYYTFLGQLGMINYDYLKSLIITQKINQQGIYKYFVKRNGEYYLQQCDDYIPVNKSTGQPFFGLSWKRPLQLIIFKMWLAQFKSLNDLLDAPNFKFLQCFGLPSYRLFNFRKQIQYFKKHSGKQDKMREYLKQYTLNKKQLIIISQTDNSPALLSLGLIPNAVGYNVQRVGQYEGSPIYKIFSCLPYQWSGKYCISKNSPIYRQNFKFDYSKNFLMTQQQVLKYFFRSLVAPLSMAKLEKFKAQDCLNIQTNGQPAWVRFQVLNTGLLSFSIQLPDIKTNQNVYPQIKYFITKSKTTQHNRSSQIYSKQRIEDSFMVNNICIQSYCGSWECFRIDYVKGYHYSATSFSKFEPGLYVMYLQTQYKGKFNLRIDSQTDIRNPQIFYPNTQLRKEIFDSTFFTLSEQVGVQVSLNNKDFEKSAVINNNFEQYGFGSIVLKVSQKTSDKIAMRVYPQKLKAAGYQLISHYAQLQSVNQNLMNYIVVSSKGKSEIIVLERIIKNKKFIQQQFPPKDAFEFFVIKPNNSFENQFS